MKTIANFSLKKAPGQDQFILMDPVTDIAVSLIHEDFITDNTKRLNTETIEKLEAGKTVEIAWVLI